MNPYFFSLCAILYTEIGKLHTGWIALSRTVLLLEDEENQ